MADFFLSVNQNIATLHTTSDDVQQTIVVDVHHSQPATDTRFAIGFVRNEIDCAVTVAVKLKPVHNRTGVPHRALRVMRPVGFAGDDIFQAVAIDVGQLHGMKFGEQ